MGQTFFLPVSSRLQMSPEKDRLSLAYNSFFTDLYIPPPDAHALSLQFAITGKGTPSENPRLTLQLCLKTGEELETAGGKRFAIGPDRIELTGEALGGRIRHHGWTIDLDPTASLVWPVYPHNPYADAPETNIEHAVAALSVPLHLKKGKYIRPGEQEIRISIKTD